MKNNKLGKVVFVIDERLRRERSAILHRTVTHIKTFADVEFVRGDLTEDEFIHELNRQADPPDLVLLPWYRYLSWKKVDASFGAHRLGSPSVAGYFCDQLLHYELGDSPPSGRMILLDFSNLWPKEAMLLTRCLLRDQTRAGVLPLTEAKITHAEHWPQRTQLGERLDALARLPQLAEAPWSKRMNSVRLCLQALWSLVFEKGPGAKSKMLDSLKSRACFEIAAGPDALAMRLISRQPLVSLQEWTRRFWFNSVIPAEPEQVLLKFADFVRVLCVPATQDVEITVSWQRSAASDVAHREVHTLWMENISEALLPLIVATDLPLLETDKDREIAQLREQIEELKFGGVGAKFYSSKESTEEGDPGS